MKARALYVNTHVGEAILKGGLAWAVDKYSPDLIVLTEVVRWRARRQLGKMFPEHEWSITGLEPSDGLLVKSGTIIIAKRDVLKRKDWRNPLVSKQRWIGPIRDKWHPIRRMTRAVFVFRDNPAVELEVGADHTWTYAGHDLFGDHPVPSGHRRQVRRYVNAAKRAIARGAAVLDIGDMNERHVLGPDLWRNKTYVQLEMRKVGMKTLYVHLLDYAFGNDKIAVLETERIPQDHLNTDHDGLVIDFLALP